MAWAYVAIYAVTALVVWRFMYLDNLDAMQRELHEIRTQKGGPWPPLRSEREVRSGQYALPLVVAVLWPFVIVALGVYAFFALFKFILFPRGIKTKFDREQELEKKLAEEKKNLEAAKKLLREEGIEV